MNGNGLEIDVNAGLRVGEYRGEMTRNGGDDGDRSVEGRAKRSRELWSRHRSMADSGLVLSRIRDPRKENVYIASFLQCTAIWCIGGRGIRVIHER